MLRTTIVTAAVAAAVTATPGPLRAQSMMTPAEVATPEALVAALYDTFQRRPGQRIDWDRFSRFFLPGALMIPNVEQTDGEFRVMTVQDFSRWIEGILAEHSPIGSDLDHGLREDEIHSVVERYGDIALVMSTYERRTWDSREVDGRGINGITLVRHDGRWWIASIVWDEESGAGPVPARYRPAGADSATPTADPAGARLTSADWLALLPEGIAKRQFILDCTNCHVMDGRFFLSADGPRSRAEWAVAVDRMISYAGAHTSFPVMTAGRDAESTAAWLAEHVSRMPEAKAGPPMPEGAAVDEFLLPDSTDLPHDVAVLPDGRILVTGMASNQMWLLDPRTGRWSTEAIPVPESNPRAVDVRSEEDPAASPDWWVLLGGPHRIARRSGSTGEWRTYPIGFYGHSIVEDSLGRVWFNSHFTRSPGVIGYVDSSTEEVVRFEIPTPDTVAGGGTPIPYGLRVAPDGSVWGTELRGNRIVRLDPASGAVRAYTMPTPESGPRRPDFDREGRFWIPEYAGNSLTLFEPESERFTRYELPVPDAAPYVVRIDHRRNVAWVGTATADAAFALDLETREFTGYPLPSSGALVRHIDIDERTGEVWLAYGGAPGIAARLARIRPAARR